MPVKIRKSCAGKGGDEDFAFEADVDDAGALRPQAGQARADERHAKADAGAEDAEDVFKTHCFEPSDRRRSGAARQQRRDGAAEHMLERAGEQHDEALDHHDHVAADLRLVERQSAPPW